MSAESLSKATLELTASEVGAIRPALDLALSRIEALRLSGEIGLNPTDPGEKVFAGRRFTEEMYGLQPAVRAAFPAVAGVQKDFFAGSN